MENYSSLLNLLSGMDSSQAEGTSGISSLLGGNRKLLIWVILFLIFFSCYCNRRGYGYGDNNCCCDYDYDYDDCCCGKHKKHKCKDCCCVEIDPCCLCRGGYGNYGYGNNYGGGLLGGSGCGINICTIAILAAIFLVRKGC
ncbi:hypothetical protein [Clostridium sp.]|uniref:hypothetical protein n=1 Tax=Clostridium sp. TaxID=1506 RepID=UPI002FCB1DD6